jgi:hypothetical protein
VCDPNAARAAVRRKIGKVAGAQTANPQAGTRARFRNSYRLHEQAPEASSLPRHWSLSMFMCCEIILPSFVWGAIDIAINTERIEIPCFTMVSLHCFNDRNPLGIENTLCD